jgi:hypothetical protein
MVCERLLPVVAAQLVPVVVFGLPLLGVLVGGLQLSGVRNSLGQKP